MFAGLLVDEVFGMQRFSQLSLIPQTPQDMDQRMVPFLRGQFIREQAWQIFSPWALVQSADFMDLASLACRAWCVSQLIQAGPD